MATIRLLPPGNATLGQNPITVHGRTYSCALGSTLDVPDFDAAVMRANGWTDSVEQAAGTGTTANRPKTGLVRGERYIDTTLAIVIQWDGATWRNPVTGAAV